jgi:acyl-CoA synthetase (AMP-forming)/AMP-acid ligase II
MIAPIPGDVQTVAALVEQRAGQHPDRETLVDAHRRLSAADVEVATRRWANAFHALGLRAGDRLAVSMGNSVDLALSHLAAMRAGLVWVGVSRAFTNDERSYVLADSGASVLLTDRSDGAACRVIDVTGASWAQLCRDSVAVELPSIDPFAPAAIAYTSGTTGRPKGVVHSQRNMLLPAVVGGHRGEGNGRIGMYLPMTSLNMQVLGPVYALVNGTCCVCIEHTDTASVVAAIVRERIERMSAASATVYDLVASAQVTASDLATLTSLTVGGSSTPDWLVDAYTAKFGTRFLSGYGLTEAPSSVTRERADSPHVAGGSGPALPQFELGVFDEDGLPVPTGDDGEICLRAASDGPFANVYTPMLGYWGTAEFVESSADGGAEDGWLHTGDVGRLDSSGELFVLDRRVDLIVRGGSNVYPAEVERVLLADERIAHCAVVAQPDARLGQLPVAFIELRGGASMSAADARSICESSLARYKVPVDFRFSPALPRNSMGKILRSELRAILEA